ncbi:Uncharacterised protein [Vibrio cholerae]|nr:Uncharacterised protein [Vibrio cholerae]
MTNKKACELRRLFYQDNLTKESCNHSVATSHGWGFSA